MIQPDGAATLVVECQVASCFICAVDASDINQDVDKLTAYFIVFCFNWILVGGYVYL
jgi:hypothetical protein